MLWLLVVGPKLINTLIISGRKILTSVCICATPARINSSAQTLDLIYTAMRGALP